MGWVLQSSSDNAEGDGEPNAKGGPHVGASLLQEPCHAHTLPLASEQVVHD